MSAIKTFKDYTTEVCHGNFNQSITGLPGSTGGNRVTITAVKFPIQFTSAPTVTLGVNGLQNTSAGGHVYFSILAEKITTTGFDCKYSLWGDFDSSMCSVSYVAINQISNAPPPFSKFVGKKIFIKNIVNDAYLRDNKSVIDLSSSKRKLEEFTVEDSGNGKFSLLNSQFNKYLSFDGTSLGHSAKGVTGQSIEWEIEEIRAGVFTFKSVPSGKYISGLSTYDTDSSLTAANADCEFEIEM